MGKLSQLLDTTFAGTRFAWFWVKGWVELVYYAFRAGFRKALGHKRPYENMPDHILKELEAAMRGADLDDQEEQIFQDLRREISLRISERKEIL